MIPLASFDIAPSLHLKEDLKSTRNARSPVTQRSCARITLSSSEIASLDMPAALAVFLSSVGGFTPCSYHSLGVAMSGGIGPLRVAYSGSLRTVRERCITTLEHTGSLRSERLMNARN